MKDNKYEHFISYILEEKSIFIKDQIKTQDELINSKQAEIKFIKERLHDLENEVKTLRDEKHSLEHLINLIEKAKTKLK